MGVDAVKPVLITLAKDEAESLSNGLSDILCIFRGIEIASPKKARQFMGIEAARELNIKIKRALDNAE